MIQNTIERIIDKIIEDAGGIKYQNIMRYVGQCWKQNLYRLVQPRNVEKVHFRSNELYLAMYGYVKDFGNRNELF